MPVPRVSWKQYKLPASVVSFVFVDGAKYFIGLFSSTDSLVDRERHAVIDIISKQPHILTVPCRLTTVQLSQMTLMALAPLLVNSSIVLTLPPRRPAEQHQQGTNRSNVPSPTLLGMGAQRKDLIKFYPNPTEHPFPARIPAHPEDDSRGKSMYRIPGYRYPHTLSFMGEFIPEAEAQIISAFEKGKKQGAAPNNKDPPAASSFGKRPFQVSTEDRGEDTNIEHEVPSKGGDWRGSVKSVWAAAQFGLIFANPNAVLPVPENGNQAILRNLTGRNTRNDIKAYVARPLVPGHLHAIEGDLSDNESCFKTASPYRSKYTRNGDEHKTFLPNSALCLNQDAGSDSATELESDKLALSFLNKGATQDLPVEAASGLIPVTTQRPTPDPRESDVQYPDFPLPSSEVPAEVVSNNLPLKLRPNQLTIAAGYRPQHPCDALFKRGYAGINPAGAYARPAIPHPRPDPNNHTDTGYPYAMNTMRRPKIVFGSFGSFEGSPASSRSRDIDCYLQLRKTRAENRIGATGGRDKCVGDARLKSQTWLLHDRPVYQHGYLMFPTFVLSILSSPLTLATVWYIHIMWCGPHGCFSAAIGDGIVEDDGFIGNSDNGLGSDNPTCESQQYHSRNREHCYFVKAISQTSNGKESQYINPFLIYTQHPYTNSSSKRCSSIPSPNPKTPYPKPHHHNPPSPTMHTFTFQRPSWLTPAILSAPSTYAKLQCQPADAFTAATIRAGAGGVLTVETNDLPMKAKKVREDGEEEEEEEEDEEARFKLYVSRGEFGKILGVVDVQLV
ncbi:uncharacterized protein BDR25DRAFT_395922 [Lindgomyces ingoldianus]|uniref:Uncharacterized protein n=1 Tax=Lindgomyces ingoldianus TaxID=673940 RepID=A0ACB6QIZ8_9PLEO|nr:uncharacterized protein BDR25DRAFT_395922 [Lindgomyces ingoldianus]KAF2466116.1 hypothetical protein BDR25DRAFT_395922 [Lindgomyces ingoldianus]